MKTPTKRVTGTTNVVRRFVLQRSSIEFMKAFQVNKTRKVYEATLSEIRQFNPVYTENMTFVFEKCQQLELKRLRFAMEMLSGFENALSDLVTPLK